MCRFFLRLEFGTVIRVSTGLPMHAARFDLMVRPAKHVFWFLPPGEKLVP